MIETGLVYIYSVAPAREFIGCGALIEGGYIATCRHVWHDAKTGGLPDVEIEFPAAEVDGIPCRAGLADACEGPDARAPDLVLLKPDVIPDGIMSLQLARRADYEIGPGHCHCYLEPHDIDCFIYGEISSGIILKKGMRQFTGNNGQSLWMEKGSSGSPVFLKEKAQQLAGIIALAVTGSKKGETREAFIVPATTIHKYLRALLERLAAVAQAEKRDIDPANLQPILAKLGQMDVPDDKIAERLDASVEKILAQAATPVPASNGGGDIEDVIKASREKLGALNTAGALDVLQAKVAEIAEEVEVQVRCLVPLLKERAAVERLSFDYEAAKKTFAEVARLAPDDVWAFIGLGDLYRITGPLDDAAKAFRSAAEAAQRQGDDFDISVSLNRLGDVQMAQGDLAGALKSYQADLAIAERLATSDPGNTLWQRDLSVSFNKIGDVQMAQEGGLAGALKSYQDSFAIRERLANSDPDNSGWQRDLSVSYEKIGDVQKVKGGLADALKSYQDCLAIRERLAKSEPGNAGWQRDLSVSFEKVGDVQKAQGDLAGALKSYNDSLAIRDRLAKSDSANPHWQYNLGISNERIGDVQMRQRDFASALKAYEVKRDIISRLAQSDPGNAGWQRDLSVSYDRIGDVQMVQGDLAGALKSYNEGLAIRDRLAKSEPGNADWQRALSVSFNKIGDVQVAQGDLSDALKSYEADLAIAERLAKSDPGNAGWQRDLAMSLGSLALVHRQSGDNAKALGFLQQGQAIMSRMTELSPDNAEWKRDLARFDQEIAELAER